MYIKKYDYSKKKYRFYFQYEKLPSSSWNVHDLRSWLKQKNIPHVESSNKEQLLRLCGLLKQYETKKFIIDEFVTENTEHIVLRLPPYHYKYNAIEMAWGVAKSHYDKHIGYNDKMVKDMWQESLNQVTPIVWKDMCIKVKRKITRHYNRFVLGLSKEQRKKGAGIFEEATTSSSEEDLSSGSDSESDCIGVVEEKKSNDNIRDFMDEVIANRL